jgi:hypothetical protein
MSFGNLPWDLELPGGFLAFIVFTAALAGILLSIRASAQGTPKAANFKDEYLARAKDIFPYVPAAHSDENTCTGPKFKGDFTAFLTSAEHKGDEQLRLQMLNNVKKCPQCGKPNGFSLPACNSCGFDLTNVTISHSDNVFTGFIYGVEKTSFPLRISIRHQTEDILVFDDPLQLSTCHVDVIPTDIYISDVRLLFTLPETGLELVNRLADEAWKVTRDQFLANEAWSSKVVPKWKNFSEAQLRAMVIAGFNFPPSQSQDMMLMNR